MNSFWSVVLGFIGGYAVCIALKDSENETVQKINNKLDELLNGSKNENANAGE